jgi:hypothetical protein
MPSRIVILALAGASLVATATVFPVAGSAEQASLLSVSAAAATPQEALVRQFDDVVFGQEHGPTRQIIRRWQSMPRVAFFAAPGTANHPPIDKIRKHLAEIGTLTGLTFHAAEKPAEATLRVGFFPRRDFEKLPKAADGDQKQYERFVEGSACLGIAAGGKGEPGSIAVGAVMIGSDIDEQLQRHCILEELVQIVGLASDACDYRPSLFCEDDYVMEMTPADRVLVQTLYDPRLTPGMSRAEAMPIVAKIIAEHVAAR